MEFHGSLTKEEFLIEFFGNWGRELATKGEGKPFGRHFTDNPLEVFEFIDLCKKEKRPAWMSVQPFKEYGKPLGIEKVFFDFDDPNKVCPECGKEFSTKKIQNKKLDKGKCPKCDVKVIAKPRLELVSDEVRRFINQNQFEPLVTRTFKGYHVYGWLQDVIIFPPKTKAFMKETYTNITKSLMGDYKWKFLDTVVVTDIMRVARIPFSMHERGVEVNILNKKTLKPGKVYNIDYYRSYWIDNSIIRSAIDHAAIKLEQRKIEAMLRKESPRQLHAPTEGKFDIRPCFRVRMGRGQMSHQQRLALLPELFYAGYVKEEDLIDQFRCFSDFKYNITADQVRWYLSHVKGEFPPYRCITLIKKGFCLKSDECPIWARKFKGKQ